MAKHEKKSNYRDEKLNTILLIAALVKLVEAIISLINKLIK